MENVLVTILCMTYNQELYIRKCLDGFVNQKTNFIFEAVIHDDASTDQTISIIQEYAEKHSAIIRPIYESENQYSKHDGSLYEILKANMRGKYIAFCEGDDYWTDPYKLQKQVDFLETHREYGLVYTNVDFYFQAQDKFEKCYITSGKKAHSKSFLEHLTNAGYIAPCTWLVRKEYVYLPQHGYVDGTFPLALDIWAKSDIYFMDESTTVYRVLNESASHSRDLDKQYKFRLGIFQIQKDYMEKYKSLVPDKVKRRLLANKYLTLSYPAIVLEETDFLKEASEFFWRHKNYILFFFIRYHRYLLFNMMLRFLYRCKGCKIKK